MTPVLPETDAVDQSVATRGGFRRYLAAAVLVRLADEGARVALVLLGLEQLRSASIGGLLVAALLIPHVVAAPTVGWLTDRARRPRLVLTVAALGFAASLATGALLVGARLSWWWSPSCWSVVAAVPR